MSTNQGEWKKVTMHPCQTEGMGKVLEQTKLRWGPCYVYVSGCTFASQTLFPCLLHPSLKTLPCVTTPLCAFDCHHKHLCLVHEYAQPATPAHEEERPAFFRFTPQTPSIQHLSLMM